MKKLSVNAKILIASVVVLILGTFGTVAILKRELSHFMTVGELIETISGDEELCIKDQEYTIIETCDKYNIDQELKGKKVITYGVCPDSYEEVEGEVTYVPTLTIVIEE